jgi:hypothetical protein
MGRFASQPLGLHRLPRELPFRDGCNQQDEAADRKLVLLSQHTASLESTDGASPIKPQVIAADIFATGPSFSHFNLPGAATHSTTGLPLSSTCS